ncbi:MAG: nucleotidyltransferase family protein [Chromatiaceae bacterium]
MTLETKKLLSTQGQALGESMFYEYRLNELGKEFAARNLAPVIVKGQAIVDLAFPKAEIRLSSDIDLLVGDDAEPIATALTELGYEEDAPHSRHFRFGERIFHQHEQRLPGWVEVHRCLDKILLRPIPYAEILARAKPSGRRGFRYPTMEDLLLLVVLHASADPLFDPERVQRDLRFLIGHGKPNMDLVWLRAHQWELSRALRRLLSGRHPQKAPTPGRWSTSKTVSYLMHQLPWHDSPLTVLRGLAKYSLARAQDRLLP